MELASIVLKPATLIFLCLLPTLLLILTVTTLLWRNWRAQAHAHAHTPPGPRGLPVIGHLHLLGSAPHHSLYQLSKVYGPLMSMRLGAFPVLVASSPTTAKLLLHTHDVAFSGRPRPRTAASHHLSYRGFHIAFAQPDRTWRLKRQLCATQLFSNKRLRALKWIREEEVGAMLRSFLTESGDSPIRLRPKLVDATSNTICRMMFGKRMSELSKGTKEESLVSLLQQAVELVGEFNVSDYVPCIASLDLQGCGRRSKIVADKLQCVVKAIIDERRTHEAPVDVDAAEDLLQVLLNVSFLTDDDIVGVLQDMFGGGTDTTAYTVEWALAELISNPKKLTRSRAEIDKVVGRRGRVREEDIGQLPYLQAVVKETMRLHPVAPFLLPHMSSSACDIMGYHVAKGTQAFVNVWAIGRDPDSWEQPLDFMPERFLQSDVDVRGFHFQLLPFGSGRRMCPGLSLGLVSAQTMLASLIQCFEWTTPSKPNLSETLHLMMMMTSPLTALPTPRLPLECY